MHSILKKIVFILSTATLSAGFCTSVQAEIYKSTTADGEVIFTDEPSKDNEKVKLKPMTVLPAISKPVINNTLKSDTKQPKQSQKFTIDIQSPSDQTTYRNNAADAIPLTYQVMPAPSQKVVISALLDGKLIDHQAPGLPRLERGEHTLTVNALSNGKIIESSQATFFVHRPSAIQRNAVQQRNLAP